MKSLSGANLLGVISLMILCVLQWRSEHALNRELDHHYEMNERLALQIREREKDLKGLNADLTQFKEQSQASRTALEEAGSRLQKAERAQRSAQRECDQLRMSVTNWSNAVAARDERLREAASRIEHLASELNSSVAKFNALASNHNAVVQELNALRTPKPN